MLEREVFVVKNNEPNMEDMKKSIEKAGGLFYQYRPCRRVNHGENLYFFHAEKMYRYYCFFLVSNSPLSFNR